MPSDTSPKAKFHIGDWLPNVHQEPSELVNSLKQIGHADPQCLRKGVKGPQSHLTSAALEVADMHLVNAGLLSQVDLTPALFLS